MTNVAQKPWSKALKSLRRTCCLLDAATVLLLLSSLGTLVLVVRAFVRCGP